MKKLAIVTLIASLSALAYFAGASKGRKPDTIRAPEQGHVAAEGKIEAMPGYEVVVGAEITGRIRSLALREGDVVRAGQLIAELENFDAATRLEEARGEQAVAEAKLNEVASGSRKQEIEEAAAALKARLAGLDLARANLNRYRALHERGVVPSIDLDEAQTAFDVAAARVKEAEERKDLIDTGPKPETLSFYRKEVDRSRKAVSYYRSLLDKSFVKAPISGTIIQKHAQEGEVVYTLSPVPLVTLADLSRLRINTEVDETDIGKIRIGDPVEIAADAFNGSVFRGRVEEIANYAGLRRIQPNNPAKNLDMKVVQVKVALLEKTPLKLGMTVDVKIICGAGSETP